jgi:hypothetical protein
VTTFFAVVPLIWLAWLALTDWVPMFPLNDLSKENARQRLLAAAINYPFPILISVGIVLGRTWSLAAALALCVLVLVGHVRSWWVPYFGAGTRAQRELYQREFSRTLKVLPTGGRDVVPDVQHMVVGVLTLAMGAATLTAMMSS